MMDLRKEKTTPSMQTNQGLWHVEKNPVSGIETNYSPEICDLVLEFLGVLIVGVCDIGSH